MAELERFVDEAESLVATDVERQRVETWRTGVWEYMVSGYDEFHAGNGDQ
jgi:hypothetical protein